MYQHAEIVHWMKNKEIINILPAQVDMDLTNICNQDCFYCNSFDHRKARPNQKKYTEYMDVLDKLATWRAHMPSSFGTTHTITYSGGGEPTLLPGYEKIIERTIDLGFLTSIITNGSHLNDLIDNVSLEKIKKISWIGIDIDAGTKDKYEEIRHSLTKESLFDRVIDNATSLVKIGATVDFKALVNELNCDPQSLTDLFIISKKVGVRLLYLRPVLTNGVAYDFSSMIPLINELSLSYQVPVKLSLTKHLPRNYNRCHQMYQFPVFCADGEIYTCCDNKGNPRFSLGRWDTGDFRDLWLSKRHDDIYNSTNTKLCPHCRPNIQNIGIQNILDDPSQLEQLFT